MGLEKLQAHSKLLWKVVILLLYFPGVTAKENFFQFSFSFFSSYIFNLLLNSLIIRRFYYLSEYSNWSWHTRNFFHMREYESSDRINIQFIVNPKIIFGKLTGC